MFLHFFFNLASATPQTWYLILGEIFGVEWGGGEGGEWSKIEPPFSTLK